MKKIFCYLITALFSGLSMQAENDMRLLRFPAIHGDKVVFTYAGDLYAVASSGGTARKLTSAVGYEMFARFSPDGKWIAFTGQYDGNTEVFLIPAEGGIPKRLTFTATLDRDDVSDRMGPNNIVMGWRDNSHIIYRSRMIEHNDFKGQLFSVSIDGGLSEQLPLPRGGFASFSADGKQMVYNRVFREFRTWKRYRGGQADDVWLYDFDSKKTTNLTNNPAQDIIPMWGGEKIYFISDRDGKSGLKKLNLYSFDLKSKATVQLTFFEQYDVKFPSIGDKAIVFENGGYLYRFDLGTQKEEKITVAISEDFVLSRGGIIDVSKNVTNYEISPDGKRALFGAHGEIFTVPNKYGNTRNLTNTSNVHERNSVWSPDGKWIAFISDASGEDEIYIVPQDGSAEPRQLTGNADTYKYQPVWSPDSKYLLWADKELRLQFADVESKKVTVVSKAAAWEYSDYCWSPDSKWIAYAQPEEKVMTSIQLYSVEKKERYPVTDGWFSSSEPSFSSDGKFLYFVSDRSFSPTYSQTEWNHIYSDMAKIYFVTLSKAAKSPFEPKSDEVALKEKDQPKETQKPEKKKEDSVVTVQVDADGLMQRIAVLPVPAGQYRRLVSVNSKLYYMYDNSKNEKAKLMLFDFDKQKETELGEIGGFEISADKKMMLVGQEGSYGIIDLPASKIELKEKLNLSDMKMKVDRRAEWKQIFNEAWRQMKYFLYDPNLHKVDWDGMRKRYETLLPFVNHRADLTYVIGEMISELNIGHAYVGGGEMPKPERIKLGLLGAQITRDPSSRYFRISKILAGQNWDNSLRSPLTEIGVDAKERDYIIAVNGASTKTMNDIYESLVGTAGKQVALTLNAEPKETGSRKVTVIPTADEHPLYYFNWVQENMKKVEKASKGKIGYIHIPDMGVNGLNQFAKYFYPQLMKEGLIIDDRGNGGGNVSPMIVERLRREIVMIDIARNSATGVDPSGAALGPKAALIDEFSASDGDIFAYRFKFYKLGLTIGKRTWGGVVGIRGSLPFVDGGYLNRPEFSRYSLEGKWVMEGTGVEPDIVVDNDPAKEFAGEDEQLNKAIEVILKEAEKKGVKLPDHQPYPDKKN